MKYKKAVIVGSGVAGAAVAEGLMKAGCEKVSVFEAGSTLEMVNNEIWTKYLTSAIPPWVDFLDPSTAEESVGPQGWNFSSTRLFLRGGTFLLADGWCLRLRPEDFKLKTRIGKGADWPISYDDLEPYYGQAEHFLQVAGSQIDKSPRRSTKFPLPAVPFTIADGIVIEAFKKLGWSYEHMPIARNTESINGKPMCLTVGTCGYCPMGSRFTPDQTFDRLAQDDRFILHLNSPVISVGMSNKTLASHVVYRDQINGIVKREDADLIVLACGTIEVPKILETSTSQGLGNQNDLLGRFLSTHPRLALGCTSANNPERFQQELDFRTFMSRHFDSPEHQADGKLFMFQSTSVPYQNIAQHISNGIDLNEIKALTIGPHEVRLEGFMEEIPQFESRVTRGSETNKFGLPKSKVHFVSEPGITNKINGRVEAFRQVCNAMKYRAGEPIIDSVRRGFHAIGTTRMADSDTEGVVDANLRVHGTDNVFVCSNSVFPSGGAVSPTLTLAALAKRLVDHLNK